MRGAENDQARFASCGFSQYLDERIAVQDNRLNLRMTACRSFGCQGLQLTRGGRIEIGKRALVRHLVSGGQHMQQDEFGIQLRGQSTGKRCARARGLSESGGMQHDTFLEAALHREMSLGTHGDDREIDLAQHLFCHGAEEQLAKPAPAPGPKKNSICKKLAGSGRNLLSGIPLAHNGMAFHAVPTRLFAPGPQHFFCNFKRARGIVVRQAHRID